MIRYIALLLTSYFTFHLNAQDNSKTIKNPLGLDSLCVSESYSSGSKNFTYMDSLISYSSDVTSRIFEKIPLPESTSDVIKQHIAKIQAFDSTVTLTPDNFYHGHFLSKKDYKKSYSSLDEFCQDIAAYLYHTHEMDSSWEKTKTPRSIIGYPDGSIKIPEIPKSLADGFGEYVSHGTIHPYDLIEFFPELVVLRDSINLGNKIFYFDEFDFVPSKNGVEIYIEVSN